MYRCGTKITDTIGDDRCQIWRVRHLIVSHKLASNVQNHMKLSAHYALREVIVYMLSQMSVGKFPHASSTLLSRFGVCGQIVMEH